MITLKEQTLERQLSEAKHLIRFLAAAWDGADSWIWENANQLDAIMEYPIVQGTGNQIRLKRIGEQECDLTKIPAAVKLMLPDQPNTNE